MLKDSWPNRLMVRAVILGLQSIGPFCLVYTTWTAAQEHGDWLATVTAWRAYAAAEAAFFVFFLWYVRHLQMDAVHPQLLDRERREELSDKVRNEIHDPEKFFSGWFCGASVEDIGREGLRQFINWSFWDGRASGDADRDEIEDNLKKIEAMMPKPFSEGWGSARPLRLTLDPIVVEARSLLWYSIIMIVDTITHLRLVWNGLQYYRTTRSTWAVFPPRPAAYACSKAKSCSPRLSYWLRPHTSKTRLPIVYLHGIGIGLWTYVDFLKELDHALNSGSEADDQVGVLIIEVLQVSSRLVASIPTRGEFLLDMKRILNSYGWRQFVLASHSYGSVLAAHILNDPGLSLRVSASLLVDPVSILLHMPDVAYNFTIRPPVRTNEWILWYFASKDPGVAYTLGRHFFWHENVLWRDRIVHLMASQKTNFTISLASDDLIVDTNAVGAYLAEHTLPDPVVVEDDEKQTRMALESSDETHSWKQRAWRGKGLDVLWWPHYDHADVFDRREDRRRLINVLVKYCTGNS